MKATLLAFAFALVGACASDVADEGDMLSNDGLSGKLDGWEDCPGFDEATCGAAPACKAFYDANATFTHCEAR